MRKCLLQSLGVLLLPLAASVGWADSITPSSVNADLNVGDSVTVHKTVTVSAGTPTTSKVDVYFLADTTGSMGGAIGAVAASASTILSTTAGLGDVQFAVGEYKDIGDSYEYRLNTAMTANQSAVTTGIGLWSASGGGDLFEAELQALDFAASQSATGWRTGSTKILVWFGDAAGHDPSGSSGTTEAQATAALQAQSIKVEAIDVGALDALGQATRITAATGGSLSTGINNSTIVAAITSAITSSFNTYSTVGLDLSEVPAGVGASVVPGSITGSFDRSVDRTFNFDLTLTGNTAGTYDFNVYGAVDGGRVATENDHLVVHDVSGPTVPDGGSTILLLSSALAGLVALRGRRQ